MSPPSFHTNHLDISDQIDFPSELLNSPASGEKYILVVGPDLVKRGATADRGLSNTYLGRLLEGMVEWCTEKKVIQEQDVVHDLRTLLHNGALVPLAYRIEEYLAAKKLKKQCLRAVLNPHSQVEPIHYWLACIPFRGYITTSYDSCIETACVQTQRRQIHKFYRSSLAHLVDSSRKGQPFILKLYGDLDNPNSIKLGHRLLTGLYTENVREQLQQLFSETQTTFIGFDKTDEDLAVLHNLVKEGHLIHQRYSTRVAEQPRRSDPIEISDHTGSTPETLSRNETLFTARIPFAKGVPSTLPYTEQDSWEGTQQGNKKVISICIFYALEDKRYQKEIIKVLNGLKNKESKAYEIEYISCAMGESLGYRTDIRDPLMSKHLIILLISLSFLGSGYYNKEHMRRVVNRHMQGAWISPILVSPCDWQGRQFDSLKAVILPRGEVPISDWRSRAKAYINISQSLEYALNWLAGY